jgi:hypothetical protein
VSIIGINKAIERAVVVDGQITVRLMMNLSSSFDHRFVDGFDAASMIQALKDALEQPATIFIDWGSPVPSKPLRKCRIGQNFGRRCGRSYIKLCAITSLKLPSMADFVSCIRAANPACTVDSSTT